MEEIAFRNWLGQHSRFKVLSIVLLLLYCGLSLNLWATILAVASLLSLFSPLIPQSSRRPAAISLSAASFSVLHLYDHIWSFELVAPICFYVGLALVLSWIRLNFGLQYAIGLHCLWNTVAIAITDKDFIQLNTSSETFISKTDTITLKRLSIFETINPSSNIKPLNIELPKATAGELLLALTYNPQYVYSNKIAPFHYYALYVRASRPIDRDSVFNTIRPSLNLQLDTIPTIIDVYRFSMQPLLAKSMETNFTGQSSYEGRASGFAESLFKRYSTRFVTDDTSWIRIHYSEALTLNQQMDALQNTYKFRFSKSTAQAKKIVITSK